MSNGEMLAWITDAIRDGWQLVKIQAFLVELERNGIVLVAIVNRGSAFNGVRWVSDQETRMLPALPYNECEV